MSDNWKLCDYYAPVGENQNFPEYIIHTEDELRKHLLSMVGKSSRIVELYPPSGQFLRVGIGGRFAGVALIAPPPPRLRMKILLASESVAPRPVEFKIQGQPSILKPDELHNPITIIDLACYYFTHNGFPDGLVWR